ncbi:hypothetical protein QJQ45_027757 [Haematococcus lacustris]|nr:hypothetical protein QJQ45_027757 [Haematococcus lacustris]
MSQFVACAAVYFFNLRGDILLERVFRADVDRTIAELFRTQILNNRDAAALQAPVRTLGSCTYMFLRHADIYILCLSRNNCNVMLGFQFMTSLATLFKSYFQGELNEANIRNNFVLMYELLDEAMDHGYPQLTDPTVLKSLITQKGWLSELGELGDLLGKKKKEEPASNATLQVTGAVSWRREGIKHKKNMLFLDLVEQVNVLVGSNGLGFQSSGLVGLLLFSSSSQGWGLFKIELTLLVRNSSTVTTLLTPCTVLRSDVVGKILIKSLLSDMPELRLGLNDAAEDATFHQCVNLGTFESQKVITFVPPDGEFELMRYRCQENIQLPFKVLPVVTDIGRTRMECNITVKSTFSSKLAAGSVVILVPVPENTSKAAILVTIGKAKYDATKKALVWKVRSFPGEAEHSLRAEVTLLATTRTEKKPWTRPPVTMQFQVPMFNASGLRVAYLQINERKLGSAYKVEKWVRKLVKSGDYLTRV